MNYWRTKGVSMRWSDGQNRNSLQKSHGTTICIEKITWCGTRELQYVITFTGLTDRGYTGHSLSRFFGKHLDEFGLNYMLSRAKSRLAGNGRMYDPVLGRMLSPDNYVQDATGTQNYNRYSYCLNNPILYKDPSGQVFVIDDLIITALIVGAITGGINTAMHWNQITQTGSINWSKLGQAFGVGFAAGFVGAYTGGTAFAAAGGGALGAGGFYAGAYGSMAGYSFSAPILSYGNNAFFGDPLMTPGEFVTGLIFSTVTGGTINGVAAINNGRDFLTGQLGNAVKAPLLPSQQVANINNELQIADRPNAVLQQPKGSNIVPRVNGADGIHTQFSHSQFGIKKEIIDITNVSRAEFFNRIPDLQTIPGKTGLYQTPDGALWQIYNSTVAPNSQPSIFYNNNGVMKVLRFLY